MKSIGIVRRIDALGRIVIPKEMRKMLYLEEGDPVDISAENDAIVLKKSGAVCVFCGKSGGDLTTFRGRSVCAACLRELGEKKD